MTCPRFKVQIGYLIRIDYKPETIDRMKQEAVKNHGQFITPGPEYIRPDGSVTEETPRSIRLGWTEQDHCHLVWKKHVEKCRSVNASYTDERTATIVKITTTEEPIEELDDI